MSLGRRMGQQVLIVQRDSVCAGDDCDAPHEIEFPVRDGEPLENVIHRLVSSRYLPSISGGKATWIVESGGIVLGVVAQQWPEAQLLVQAKQSIWSVLSDDAECRLYLKYWCQVDPHIVLDCLRHGTPLPDKYSGGNWETVTLPRAKSPVYSDSAKNPAKAD